MIKRYTSLLALCTSAMASSGTYIDESKVLTVTIADTGLTRITVQGDGIEDVYGHPVDISDRIQLHKSGHVFITGEGLSTSLYLTLITQSGKTQDLKVLVSKKSPEPIILKTKTELPKVTQSDFMNWMKLFVRGDVPSGFVSCGISEGKRIGVGYTALPKIAFRNQTHRVTIFDLKADTSDTPIQLSPQPIARLNEAVFFNQQQLVPEKKALMFIIKPLTKKDLNS